MSFIFPDYNLFYVWLFFIIIFIVIELVTFNLTTLWFAFGSFISMICAYLKFSIIVQIIVFLSVSIVLAILAKPIAVKYLKVGKHKTNIDSLIGETGVVIKTIKDISPGHVKVKGQDWSADSASGETIEVGEKVEIMEIKGVKLIVKSATWL
ncbi:MAG: NfeD family protein [Spirochaetaceae bacterium]|nr:NfeD family protein [Spirochaetaceae bacterium]